MAKLILSLEGSMIREVPLDKERILIGRKPSNEIQIENLAVSGEHACIVTILNDSFLEDLGSTNGTLVNGNPIKKHILQNNDVIEIGKYKLKYVAEAPAAGHGNEDFEKTMILRAPPKVAAAPAPKPVNEPAPPPKPSTPPPTPRPVPPVVKPAAPAAPAPAAAPVAATPPPTPAAPVAAAPAAAPAKPAEAQPLAAVQILTGPSAGKELDLVKNLTTLGKPGLQVAVITRRPQGYFITHVEGAKFPVINGKMIDAQAQPLQDHDVIELAGVKMEFFVKK